MALDNGRIRAEFRDRGLVSIGAPKSGRTLLFSDDPSSVTIDGEAVVIGSLGPAEIEMTPAKVAYRYIRDPYTFDVVYELKPAWDFLTKQIIVTSARSRVFHVDEVRPLETTFGRSVMEELKLKDGAFGAVCRFGDADASAGPAWSVFFMLQNPFMSWTRRGREAAVSYAPDMDWSRDFGPFASERLCIGLAELQGTRFPAKAVPEWTYVADFERLLRDGPSIDVAESNALVECVRAFLLYKPTKSIRVHVPGCENDYQIDVSTADGWAEYKRILDMAAALGCGSTLFAPANREFSSLEENRDAWGWENLLFFSLGQKLRKGEWIPARDPVPASLRDKIDYGKSKGLSYLAYAYPPLPFMQDPAWTKWAGSKLGGYNAVDTGLRGFQDWWIQTLVDFVKKTGAGGFSFDHWWIAYVHPHSLFVYRPY